MDFQIAKNRLLENENVREEYESLNEEYNRIKSEIENDLNKEDPNE